MPALDDPERAWERMAEIKLALPRLAAELRELTHVNRGLLFSTMRYVNALLGALGSTSGYKENGVIVLQEGPRSNVCGDA